MEKEEEEGERNNVSSRYLNDWEHIQLPPLTLQSQSQQLQVHLTQSHSLPVLHTYGDLSIFPPSNHEGLPLPSSQQQPELLCSEDDDDEDDSPEPEPRFPPSDVVAPLRQLSESPPRFAVVVKRFVCSKFLGVASLARSYYVTRSRSNWSFPSAAAGLAAGMVMALWYLRWQRWRRLSRQEKMDRVILLIQNQDEKINQLLDQVAQLNELLSSSHRVPIFRSI